MSFEKFRIGFTHQGTDYKLHLVKGIESDYTVKINGVNWSILCDKEKIKVATEIFLFSTP